MTGMYNNMTFGLQGGVTSGFGPMSTGRASAGSTHRRFHPYCVGNQRSAYEASSGSGLSAGHHLSFSVEPDTYLLADSRPTLGAGSFLVNSLFYPDFLPITTDIQQRSCQPALDTNMQRNMHGPATEARSNFQVSSSVVRKDRDHPFYWRKRVEPAEGMTRTRDKYRVVYTEKQRKGLEQEYNTNKFITAERKAHISEELNLSMRQIKIWFQNRRAKERRDSRKSKDTEQTDSENSIEDVNNIVEHSPNSLPKADFQTSCRFTGSDAQSKERLNSSEQFRLMNHLESGGYSSNRFASSNDCLFSSRDSSVPAKPVSPSEWDRPAENHFIPYLDVSPLTGNMNFDIELRL